MSTIFAKKSGLFGAAEEVRYTVTINDIANLCKYNRIEGADLISAPAMWMTAMLHSDDVTEFALYEPTALDDVELAEEVINFFRTHIATDKLRNDRIIKTPWRKKLENIIGKLATENQGYDHNELALISKLPGIYHQEMLIEKAIVKHHLKNAAADIDKPTYGPYRADFSGSIISEVPTVTKNEKESRAFLVKTLDNELLYMLIDSRGQSQSNIVDLALKALPEVFTVNGRISTRTTMDTGFSYRFVYAPTFNLEDNV